MSWQESLAEYAQFLMQKHDISIDDIRQELLAEKIPSEAFSTELTPLQAAAKYLTENKGKTPKEAAAILGRTTTEINKLLLTAKKAPKLPDKGTNPIPAQHFADKRFSASEHLVRHLEAQGLTVAQIANLLGKAEQTIWTLHYRASKKGGGKS